MKYKGILVDCDGVVLHEGEMFSEILAREKGLSRGEVEPFFVDTFVPYILTGKKDLKVEIEPWLSRWNWDGSVDELLEKWFAEEQRVDKAVLAELRALREKGVRLFLVTNQEKYRTAYLREAFSDVFDAVYSSAEIGHKKPSKEFFECVLAAVAQTYSLRKQDLLYVDDSEGNVQSATSLGITSIHVEQNGAEILKSI